MSHSCLQRHARSAIAAALLCVLPCAVQASSWTFIATITEVGGDTAHPSITTGTGVLLQVDFDPATPDLQPGSITGTYDYDDLALWLGSPPHVSTTANPGSIQITDDAQISVGPDIYRDGIAIDGFPEFATLSPTFDLFNFTLGLTTEGPTPPSTLSSDGLPSPPPDLVDFDTLRRLSGLGYFVDPPGFLTFNAVVIAFGESGSGPLAPVLPVAQTTNPDGTVVWHFANGVDLCVVGCWVDPLISNAFTYDVVGPGHFTAITGFPTGFQFDLEVSVGGTSLGSFGPGDSVDFSGFPGGGVTSFTVSGISPAADVGDPTSFPLQVALDSASTQFTMTSAPAGPVPSLGGLGPLFLSGALLGTALLVGRARGEFRPS